MVYLHIDAVAQDSLVKVIPVKYSPGALERKGDAIEAARNLFFVALRRNANDAIKLS